MFPKIRPSAWLTVSPSASTSAHARRWGSSPSPRLQHTEFNSSTMQPQADYPSTLGSNVFSLAGSPVSSSLPSSLGTIGSPKLPILLNKRSRARTRASSLSFMRPPRLSTWVRSLIFAAVFVLLVYQGITRTTEGKDRKDIFVEGKKTLSWAVSRFRPVKVAIYCGTEADYDITNSIIASLSLNGIRQRVKPSIYGEVGRDLEKLTTGQPPSISSFTDQYTRASSLLRTGQHQQDVIFIPPSKYPVDAVTLLNKQKTSNAVFIIKDPDFFINSFLNHPGLPILSDFLDEKRISFLLVESRHTDHFITRLGWLFNDADDPLEVDLASRVWSYTPIMDTVKVPSNKLKSSSRKNFFNFGYILDNDSEATIKHIHSLSLDFAHWLKEDHDKLGYNLAQDPKTGHNVLQVKQNAGKSRAILHIHLPFWLENGKKNQMIDKLRIPQSMKAAVLIHKNDDGKGANGFYGRIAKMQLLLPSHAYSFPASSNTTTPSPYEPIIPISLSTRTHILLPHSLSPSYSSFLNYPALIEYPDNPNMTERRGIKAISIFEAVKLVHNGSPPRVNLAINAKPWLVMDKEPFWETLKKKVENQNIETFAGLLKM